MNRSPEKHLTRTKVSSELVKRHLSQSKNIDEENLKNPGESEPFQKGELDRQKERDHFEDLEKDKLEQENKRFRQDTKLRKKYANRGYRFMVGYTIFVAVVVVASGLPPFWEHKVFEINDMPLSALIGSAFASAVSLVAFVIKGLFPHRPKPDKG